MLTDAELRGRTEYPAPGSIWRHYKGDLYAVVCCSVAEDTLEPLVTYCGNAGVNFTRTLADWREIVKADGPDGATYVGPRFRPGAGRIVGGLILEGDASGPPAGAGEGGGTSR